MLTISIPTYNRAEMLDQTLAAIASWSGELKDVPLRVHDNASTDDTPNIVDKWKAHFGDRLTVLRHSRNLGLIGNYISCIDKCTTAYVWIMGDDDKVNEAGAQATLHTLSANSSTGILALNYRPVSGSTHRELKPAALPADMNQRFPNGRDFVEACQRYEYGSLMFITAVVLRCEIARNILSQNQVPRESLALPFYISAACAAETGAKLVPDVVFDGIYGVGSWRKSAFTVFNLDLPEALMVLVKKHDFSKGLLDSFLARYAIKLFRPSRYALKHPCLWWRAFRMMRTAQATQREIK